MAQLARKAVMSDWPGIEILRDASFRAWGLPVQERDFLDWYVVEAEGRITAALGYIDKGQQRDVTDWYAEDTRFGKRGTSAILTILLAEADEQGFTIVGVSAFPTFVEALLKRGFKFLGIAVYRPSGGS
jgi:hypothetical protein